MAGLLAPFVKSAGTFPIWTRIPGTPFSLPGHIEPEERLTGMSTWVERDKIEEIARLLQEGRPQRDIERRMVLEGLPSHAALGAGGGLTAGLLAARLYHGEPFVSPLKKLWETGLHAGLPSTGHIPWKVKAIPVVGAGLGGLLGTTHWASGALDRRNDTREAIRGLLAERVLQRNALREAIKSNQPYSRPLLSGVPLASSTVSPTTIVYPNGGV